MSTSANKSLSSTNSSNMSLKKQKLSETTMEDRSTLLLSLDRLEQSLNEVDDVRATSLLNSLR